MRDIGISSQDIAMVSPETQTLGLALEVIGRLVATRDSGAVRVLDHLVNRLAEAARGPDATALRATLALLRSERITDCAIVSQYIPEAARRLGEGWQADSLSFLDVTMAVAKLAELTRELGNEWRGDDQAGHGQSSVLVVVPPGEQHTLGAMVLACLLRQEGVSVCLRLSPSLTELAALVATRRFSGAMISVGSHDKVEGCAVLVRTLHALGKSDLPVAVGGSILDEARDLLVATGADLVSNRVDEALMLFGIKTTQNT